MMNLKNVETTEELIDRILSSRAAEVEQLTQLIAGENDSIAAANKAMETATAAGDLKAYQKAKAERQNAADAKEMHESRLEALNQKPLITKLDYEKIVADIFAEIAAADDQTKQQLCKLSDSMNSAALELQTAINRANHALQRLQHDIFRDADKSRSAKTGEILFIDHETKAIRTFSTVSWGRAGVQAAQYAAYTGRKAAE